MNYRHLLLSITLAATALSACQKETVEYKTIETVTADISELNVYEKTKTSVDQSSGQPKLVWTAGDEIKLFNAAGQWAVYTLTSGEGTTTGSFSVKAGQGAIIGESAFMVYPSDREVSVSGSEISLSIPTEYAGTMQFPMAGKGTLDRSTGNLKGNFASPFRVAKVDLESFSKYGDVNKIDIIFDAPVSGNVIINVETKEITCQADSTAKRHITISDPSAIEGKPVLVPVHPNKNAKLYVTTNNGVYCVTLPKASTKSDDGTVTAEECEQVVYPEAAPQRPLILSGIVWAPVNCGYDPINYKYGKMYQWGRKDGCGYKAADETSIYDDAGALIQETSTASVAILASNEDPYLFHQGFYASDYDWLAVKDDYRWNDATGDNSPNKSTTVIPHKTKYDPCPDGWRVPTYAELSALTNDGGYSIGGWDSTCNGYWFSGTPYTSVNNGLFLPAGGFRYFDGDAYKRGCAGGYWSSSVSSSQAWGLTFTNSVSYTTEVNRAEGLLVRCVLDF